MKRLFAFAIISLAMFLPVATFAQSTQQIDELFQDQQEALNDLESQLEALESQVDIVAPVTTSEELKVRVVEVVKEFEVNGVKQLIFTVDINGEHFEIDTTQSYLEGIRYSIKEGDRVYIQVITQNGEIDQIYLVNVVRNGALVWMGLIFLVIVVAVGRLRGLLAVLGLVITLGVIFGAVVPLILAGYPPILVTWVAALVILAINMHLAHGFSKGTLAAFLSTAIGATLVVIFGHIFVAIADLSGLASEDAILLYYQDIELIIPRGILLAGIILGATGVLDDIAITQGEIVSELQHANPKFTRKELYTRAMRVGRHHIASTINTLVLAYAGVALPLLLLFAISSEIGAIRFLNEEPIVEEIVRTLAGTLGLVLTVPIATWLATLVRGKHHH